MQRESKHTPEPWEVYGKLSCKITSKVSSYVLVADCKVSNVIEQNEMQANTARIVACVNALAGIENPVEFVQNAKKLLDNPIDPTQKDNLVVEHIVSMNKHMAEMYMRHDYRSMYEIWEKIVELTKTPSQNGQIEKCDFQIIRNLFNNLSKRHDVDIDALNIHISHGEVYISKYTPGNSEMFKTIEILNTQPTKNK